MCEFTVVGEDEQPGGLRIQPADVEQAFLEAGDEPGQVGAAVLVAQRADDADRFVEHQVTAGGVQLHRDAVHRDEVGVVHPAAEFGDYDTVDGDAARLDEDLAGPAGSDAGGGHPLLQPHPVGGRVTLVRARSFSGGHRNLPTRRITMGRSAAVRRAS